MQSTVAGKALVLPVASEAQARGRIGIVDFAIIAAELLLVLVLLRQFTIEGKAFVQLAALAFAGFVVHAFLPLRLRLPFFSALSLLSIPMVLGFANGAWLVGIGFGLIAICNLPVSVRIRSILLFAAGGVLIAQRAKLLPVPWSEAIWPILASMFMFRLIVYFYDLRHDKTEATPSESIGYFFMLPNVCFPLFPVIDFKTWRRSHYAGKANATYQKGVDWIVRGVIHLILYRYVYHNLTLAPSEVTGPSQLSQYLVANFLLYLRVSGLFHVVVGMLYLFGFNLPETHKRYLLASSFTDFWRRINIYWKDFMQKIFYFPAVLALRRFGTTKAVIFATLYVFLLTWFLHSYQWFWLRGSWLFVWQDILFWTVLGVLVVLNSLYEIKYGRKRSLGKAVWTWRQTAVLVAKTYATFWFICILWSFWTADTFDAWVSLWSALKAPFTVEALTFPLIVLAVIVVGSLPEQEKPLGKNADRASESMARERFVTVASMLALVLVSVEGIHTKLGTEVATLVHGLRSAHLSRLDNAKLERGYYESLLSVDRFNSQLWEVYTKKPANWVAAENSGLKRFVGGFGQIELIPSVVSTTSFGAITTNRWGMRDKDYSELRPPETLRAAVLGASSVMGWGVGDEATFEAILEERLNKAPLSMPFKKVELLNFGIPGYNPPQQLVSFERSLRFQPNAVLYIATGREITRSNAYMAEAVTKQLPIPYAGLQSILAKSGVRPDMDETTMLKLFKPHGPELLKAVYGSIAERSRELGIRPVWVFLPQVREGEWQDETAATVQIAKDAGFAVINLEDVYRGRDIATIRLAEWDDHPNALGHQLVAQRLYNELAANAAILGSPWPAK